MSGAPESSSLRDMPLGLMRRQAYFLNLLASLPSRTRRDYQKLAGISDTTARKDLAELAATHLIVRHGSARACRYSLASRHAAESSHSPARTAYVSREDRVPIE